MKQFLRRSLSLLLAVVMLAAMIPLSPLEAHAVAPGEEWDGTKITWMSWRGSETSTYYRPNLYIKNPKTNKYELIWEGHYVYGSTDRTAISVEDKIVKALLSRGLAEAVFAFSVDNYRTSRPDDPTIGTINHDKTFSLLDLIKVDCYDYWEDEKGKISVGENISVKLDVNGKSETLKKIKDAGYKLELTLDVDTPDKDYAIKGDMDKPLSLQLSVEPAWNGKSVSFTAAATLRNSAGTVISSTSTRKTSAVNLHTITGARVYDIMSPSVGQSPDYSVTVYEYQSQKKTSGMQLYTGFSASAPKYAKDGVAWFDVTANRFLDPNKTEFFQAGHTYQVLVYATVSKAVLLWTGRTSSSLQAPAWASSLPLPPGAAITVRMTLCALPAHMSLSLRSLWKRYTTSCGATPTAGCPAEGCSLTLKALR